MPLRGAGLAVSRYAAPMRPVSGSASLLLVRVAAVSVASVLLGVLAHGSIADVLPRPGALFVIVVLVLMLVGGVLAGGRGAGRWARRHGWSVPFEDVAAAVALVAGQALVHWSVLPVGVPLSNAMTVSALGHGHGGAVPVGAVLSHHGSGTGAGMLAGHAVAAVLVAVVLQWVEVAILGLGQVLRIAQASTASCLGVLGARITVAPAWLPAESGDRVRHGCSADVRPRLRVTLLPLVRRGPPTLGWI